MITVILDCGSGNTCGNDHSVISKMIDEIAKIDSREFQVIFKWQLFSSAPPNIPLTHESFRYAYCYAKQLGYKTTSSVFDKESLDFLLSFDVPFVKIACRKQMYSLIGDIPRKVRVYASYNDDEEFEELSGWENIQFMYCVPKYPAEEEDYNCPADEAISDHSIGFKVLKKYDPDIWECHYVLERDKNNPDAGLFAKIPKELEAIL